ncbi:MAG: VanW family protein, partial [bacterium]|nr:VanW family protein [bacterium]
MFSILATFLPLFFQAQTLMQAPKERVLVTREISLSERYPNRSVNEVFKDNILLNLAYMRGVVNPSRDVDWDTVKKPFTYSLTLHPGEVFAYHDDVLPSYTSQALKTTNAHFNSAEGFKSDGYLVGDGVCHLASLIYWAAKDAHLESLAPTNHNFAN